MLLLAFWLWVAARFLPHRLPHRPAGRRFVPAALPCLRTRKPDWVIDEVVRLKALMSDAGCRRIADTFNRLHAARHRSTVFNIRGEPYRLREKRQGGQFLMSVPT